MAAAQEVKPAVLVVGVLMIHSTKSMTMQDQDTALDLKSEYAASVEPTASGSRRSWPEHVPARQLQLQSSTTKTETGDGSVLRHAVRAGRVSAVDCHSLRMCMNAFYRLERELSGCEEQCCCVD